MPDTDATEEPQELLLLQVMLSRTRVLWLSEMARERGQTIDALVTDLLHNASLDHQMDRASWSDPDATPAEAAAERAGRLG